MWHSLHRLSLFARFEDTPFSLHNFMARLSLFLFFIALIHTSSFAENNPYRIRAIWLTTNHQLDWPTTSSLSAQKQQEELSELIASIDSLHFNTVLFQVRFRGETAYRSNIEPFSKQFGDHLSDGSLFDPLAFAIEECHKRGIECHAWITTYPIGSKRHTSTSKLQKLRERCGEALKLYQNEWVLDPGHPKTDSYLLSIVEEIVQNYDIDGVHFDYIRYPDKAKNFPDKLLFAKYGKGQDIESWRRNNITEFVAQAYSLIKKNKSWVQVSSAPLGIYRSLDGEGNRWSAYESVYQDAAEWLRLGIHDALFPMAYLSNELFFPYTQAWVQKANGRIIVPGIALYKMLSNEQNWDISTIMQQMTHLKKIGAQGEAYFRQEMISRNLKGIKGVLDSTYRYPANLPPLSWLSNQKPASPNIVSIEYVDTNRIKLSWQAPSDNTKEIRYNVYRIHPSDNIDITNPKHLISARTPFTELTLSPTEEDEGYLYVVTAIDRFRNESAISEPQMFIFSSQWTK